MLIEQALLAAIPDDPHAALALADHLEENSDPRGEMLRLVWTLTRAIDLPRRSQLEHRLRDLLVQGVRPIGPFREVKVSRRVSMTFAWIPPGCFLMGCKPREAGQQKRETPQHPVTLTRGFWLGVHPVTQAQWQSVMRSNPSHFRGETLPVDSVSWDTVQKFCPKLASRLGAPIRLPTEAEWEYACRAGTTTPFHLGRRITVEQVNFNNSGALSTTDKSYRQKPLPVGSFGLVNAWGLYDMHGNVWEWCQDCYANDWYRRSPEIDPVCQDPSDTRLMRGGSWFDPMTRARSAYRHFVDANVGASALSCRVVMDHS